MIDTPTPAATATPDRACPATAPEVAHRLGQTGVPAFDLSAVCSGFLYALATGRAFVHSGQADSVLVIAAEAFTTLIDPEDRTTRPIFGDGAGAVVLRAGETGEPGTVHGVELHSNGALADLIASDGGGSRARAAGDDTAPYLRMQGKATYVAAVRDMESVSRSVLASVGWDTTEVHAVVGHQANARIILSLMDRLGLDPRAAILNIDHLGNTSAASIPLALTFGVGTGQLVEGSRVLLSAFGAGATWGASAITWPEVKVEPYQDSAMLNSEMSTSTTSTGQNRSVATARA